MGIGVSIVLIAIGAILTFALNVTVSGVNLDIIGIILMCVGGVGLIIALGFLASARPRRGVVTEERVLRDHDVY